MEFEKHVLGELDKIEKKLDIVSTQITAIRIGMEVNKIKIGFYGMLGGTITSSLTVIFILIKGMIK